MKKRLSLLLVLAVTFSMLFNACTPAVETEAENPAAEAEAEEPAAETEAPVEVEETQPVAEEAAVGGGTLKYAVLSDPDTLDPTLTAMAVADIIMGYMGGSLVWMAPDQTYEPYLAESWTTSEDGLVWEFKIRQDVKFHDGTPMTAHDFAFAYTRALDPATASPATGPMLGAVTSVEAVDDYTLRLTLSQPNAPILYGLADPGYLQPINQAIFESMGADAYGRAPVGVGPFIFKEWSTGEKIVLERNPEYTWGPASLQNQGPYNLQAIEFVIIPEYSTILAGLESGEIDVVLNVASQDVSRLEEAGTFEVFSYLTPGIGPYVVLNVSKPPFDDVHVRQAFNMAVNKEALIQVAVQGDGEVQNGYLSSTVMGYWPGVEEFGYDYDLEGARALMEEAGYALNADGIWEKDGQPLSMILYTNVVDMNVKTAQVLAEQYAELGVQLEIQQLENNVLYPQIMAGDYQLSVAALGYSEADLMYLTFHSTMIGGLNLSYLNDPEMDALLDQSRAESDQAARQEILNQLQQKIAEEAYVVPLFAPMAFIAASQRVQGVVYYPQLGSFDLSAAYIVE